MAKLSALVMPTRILNDERGIFGLWMGDFAAAICLCIAWCFIFDGTSYAILGIPAGLLFLILLSPIRLTTRRKIIRDYLRKFIRKKILYDPAKHIRS